MAKSTLSAFLVGALVVSAGACGGQAEAAPTTPPDRPALAPTATTIPAQAEAATPVPTLTATPMPVPTATAVPMATPTPEPTATPTPSPTPTPTMGKWWTGTYTDPLDDSILTLASLLADSGKGTYGDPVVLEIACQDGKTGLMINWESYLGIDDPNVTWRIDDAPARTYKWTISTVEYDITFFPPYLYGSGETPVPLTFITKLMEADQLIARVEPYMGPSITAFFDLTGMENAVEGVRSACGW